MLSCKDVSRLVSESRDRDPGFFERIGITVHLWICLNCRRFMEHMKLLEKAFLQLETDDCHCSAHGPKLSDDARERIRQKLRG
jgi:hypothetical protein